jgi:TolA-binding protein
MDVHPDDLIDLARRGPLDAHDAARLDAHLALCPACRLELQMGSAFDAQPLGLGGDPERFDGLARAVLGTSALGAVRSLSPAPPASTHDPARETSTAPEANAAPETIAPSRSRPIAQGLVAAAVILLAVSVGGGAAGLIAYTLDAVEIRVRPTTEPAAEPPPPPEDAPPTTMRPIRLGEIVVESETPEAADASETTEVPTRRRRRAPDVAPGEVITPAESAPTASELFEQASAARRRGEFVDAVEHYAALQRDFPRSREAAASRVPYGRLLLDRMARPADALAQFDRYLSASPRGTLAQEALVGRALAYRNVGQAPDELAAWRMLLSRHPDGPHTRMAERRIAELTARP